MDDGSTDDGAARARSLEPRINVIFQRNAGEQVARNVGLANATSEIVAFLDQDDIWHSRHLELTVEALRVTGTAVAPRLQPFECEPGADVDLDLTAAVSAISTVLTAATLAQSSPSVAVVARRRDMQAIGGYPSLARGTADYIVLVASTCSMLTARSLADVSFVRWQGGCFEGSSRRYRDASGAPSTTSASSNSAACVMAL